MSQPNPNFDYSRGQGNRRPRGHDRSHASSNQTPAPQASPFQDPGQPPWAQGSGAAHSRAIRNPQRHSDPFFYDIQSVPYWDDANGAIHEIPSIRPKSPARKYAGSVGKLDAQQHYNQYAEIVGEGPFGKNQARYMDSDALGPSLESPAYEDRTRNLEFAPYFNPEDPRNDEDLRGPRKDNFGAVSAPRNINKVVHEGVIDKPGAAAAKQSAGNADDPFSTTPFDEPKVFSKPMSLFKTPTTPKKFRSKYEYPVSPRGTKQAAFEAIRTESKQENPLSVIIEAPSPLTAPATKQSTRQNVERTPVLDEVLRLRAEEQALALAELEGELLGNRPSDGYAQKTLHPVAERASDSTRDLNLSGSRRRAERLHDMDDPPPIPAKSAKRHVKPLENNGTMTEAAGSTTRNSSSSSVYSGDASADEDEISQLTKAVASLRLFQDLSSPPAERSSFQRYSAVLEGLDLNKIEAAKGDSTKGSENEQKKRTVLSRDPRAKAEVELDEGNRFSGSDIGDKNDKNGKANAQSSGESFETVASDGYEQISAPKEVSMVQNGVKRRWYKGFRKV